MNKKPIIILSIGCAGLAYFLYNSNRSSEQKVSTSDVKNTTKSTPFTNESKSDEQYFASRTFIPSSQIDKKLLEIMKAFESKDADEVARLFEAWFHEDEMGALKGFQKTDGFFLEFGIDPPYELMANLLLEKYQGEKIMEIVSNLPGDSMSTELMVAQMMKKWDGSNQDTLLTWLKENQSFISGHALTTLLSNQVETYDATKLTDVANKYFQVDNSDPRREMFIKELLDGWIVKDPDAAGEYINSLPEEYYKSPSLVGSIQTYATHTSSKDAAGAMKWADQITDPATKIVTQAVVASAWLKQDPDTFNKWRSEQSFTQEERYDFDQNLEILLNDDSSDTESSLNTAQTE